MLFSPPNPLLGLWDTWIFPHDGTFHLYYMQRDLRDFSCKVIGHATSSDLAHWRNAADAITLTRPPHWSAGPLMTGMVVERGPNDFLMYYGGMVDGVQRIGVARSNDLYDWTPYAGNPILEPDGRWYETDPKLAANLETAWRDPCIVFDDETQQYYAFFCARVPGSDYGGCGCIGVASSRDLLSWQVHPPVYVSDRFYMLEVPDVFKLNGSYYLMFSTGVCFGAYHTTADPQVANGTFYLRSDHLLSGWYEPEDSIVVGSREGRLDSYVGRTFIHDGRRLFHHHYVVENGPLLFDSGSLGSIKQMALGPDGALCVRYYDALEPFMRPRPVVPTEQIGPTAWRINDSFGVETDDGALLLLGHYDDLMLTATLRADGGRAGFVFAYGALPAQGLAVLYNPASRTVEIGMVKRQADDTLKRYTPIQTRRLYPHQLHDDSLDVRILVKDQFVDLYVNDQLTLVFVWQYPLRGACGLYADDSRCVFTRVDIRDFRLSQERSDVSRTRNDLMVAPL